MLYSITSIKRLDNKGGLLINNTISIDYRYKAVIEFGSDLISFRSDETDDNYQGKISVIDFDGHRNPQSIADIIDWIKPGGVDFGGDKGISVTVQFDTTYFSGDGSVGTPISFAGVKADGITILGDGTTTNPLHVDTSTIPANITADQIKALFAQDALDIDSDGKLVLLTPVAESITVRKIE